MKNKKGLLNNPQSFVILFAIVASIMVTVGFGIQSAEYQGATTNGVTYFEDVKGEITSTNGLKGTADESTDVIDPSDTLAQSETTEVDLIREGLQSLKSLGSTFSSTRKAMTDGGSIISLDPIYINLVIFTMIVILFVLIYTWVRGK